MEAADSQPLAAADAHDCLPAGGPVQVVRQLTVQPLPVTGRMEARVVVHLWGMDEGLCGMC